MSLRNFAGVILSALRFDFGAFRGTIEFDSLLLCFSQHCPNTTPKIGSPQSNNGFRRVKIPIILRLTTCRGDAIFLTIALVK